MLTDRRVQFELPWPESVNLMYRPNVRTHGRILTDKARSYIEMVWVTARLARAVGTFRRDDRIAVTFEVFMPDKRRRDLDNLLKLLQDSLTQAGIWHDDSQIDDLRIFRSATISPGGKIVFSAKVILADDEQGDYADGKPAG